MSPTTRPACARYEPPPPCPLVRPPESELPDDEPEATRFAMLDGEKVARMIHYDEENTSEYSHATIDLFVDPARRERGPEAIETLVAHLAGERGTTASRSTPR